MWDFQESVGSIKTPIYLNFCNLSKSQPLDDMENDLEAGLWWVPKSRIHWWNIYDRKWHVQLLNLKLQQIMGNEEPFGGISLITFGDLFQLKPVFDKWIFENSQIGYDAIASNIWAEYFTLFELTEIIRQKDGKEFAELLNRLREGKHSKDDIALLKQSFMNVRPEEDSYPFNITH